MWLGYPPSGFSSPLAEAPPPMLVYATVEASFFASTMVTQLRHVRGFVKVWLLKGWLLYALLMKVRQVMAGGIQTTIQNTFKLPYSTQNTS